MGEFEDEVAAGGQCSPKVLGAHQSARHPPCLEQKLPQCYTLNDFLRVSALGHSKKLKKMKFATEQTHHRAPCSRSI